MNIAFYVLTYNRPKILLHSLNTLAANTNIRPNEFWIIDDGSKEDVKKVIKTDITQCFPESSNLENQIHFANLKKASQIIETKKNNKEFVTTAEKEAERLMTLAVKKRYPEQAIVGEEHGYTTGSQTRWVFDPVDGTSAMIRTAMAEAFDLPLSHPTPSFGVTVAIVDNDDVILGIVTELQPRHGTLLAVNTWVGMKNKKSWIEWSSSFAKLVSSCFSKAYRSTRVCR